MESTHTEASLETVSLKHITPSPFNQREFGKSSKEGLDDLAANIKQNGVINPITVRPRFELSGSTDPDGFELVAGERRWRAAKIAGLKQIPAVVRDLTDAQAADIIVSENLYREDLHPMEEARQVDILLKSHDNDAKIVSDVIGKPLSWIVRRANLVNLTPKWIKAIKDEGSKVHDYTASHLELVARLPANQQDDLLNLEPWTLSEMTVKDLDAEINSGLQVLSKAPFKLDDAALYSKAGACVDCPKRSDCRPGLFDEDPDEPAKTARCLDEPCWQEKSDRVIKAKIKELTKADGVKPLILRDRQESKIDGAVWGSGFQAAKKADKGSKKALWVNGPKAGKVAYVKAWSSSSSTTASGSKAKTKDTLATKRARLASRRGAHVSELVLADLEKVEFKKVDISLVDCAALLCLLSSPYASVASSQVWKKFDATADKDVPAMLWGFLQEQLADLLSDNTMVGSASDRKDRMADAERVSDLIGSDFKAYADEAEVKHPEPASWTKKKKAK